MPSNDVHADAREPDEGGYWTARGAGRRTYHADPSCHYLRRAENTHQLPPGETPLRGKPCSACTAVHDESDGGDARAD
jgi:hypothetical protein